MYIYIIRICIDPTANILVTTSDDNTWKMWTLQSESQANVGQLVLTGEGHKDWVSNCDFHPRYRIPFLIDI